jgi:hypothetical protein
MTNKKICPICFDEINYSCRLDCNHRYCKICIFKYIEIKINDREPKIYCPDELCNKIIPYYKINDIIKKNNELLNKYKNICDLGKKLCLMCSICNNICKKKKNTNKVFCSNCKKYYCYICNEHHKKLADYDDCPNELNINNTISEITLALKGANIKLCPICRIVIYREDGCDSIRCKYCRVKFCWNCLKTQSIIDKMKSHNCRDFDGYLEGSSDAEYVDGFN